MMSEARIVSRYGRAIGACYHAPGTKMVLRVGSVDRAARTFSVTMIKLK